jgi:LysR family transcriptional regulator, glycine cleavage system transcriptional activator
MRSTRLPPLNALRAFEAAARHASFSRAADELGVTHGAVSKQIRVLEDDLRKQLFSRGVRQVKLTSAGRELMAEIGPALERIGAIAAVLRRGPLEETGQVRINTRPSFALRWLIPHLPRFVRAYPGIEPQVTTSTLEPARLSPSGFDIAIRRATPGRGGSAWPDGMRPRAFMRESALPVASPLLLGERPVRRAEDLNAHVLLHTATRGKDWEDWLALVRCSELRPAGELWFEHQQFTLQAAIDGMGVALGLSVLAAADLADGRLAPALPGGPRLQLAPYCYVLSPHAPGVARQFALWLEQEGASVRAQRGPAV